MHAHMLSRSVSNSLGPYGLQPDRLLYPWDSPDRDTGVGCHADPGLLQGGERPGYRFSSCRERELLSSRSVQASHLAASLVARHGLESMRASLAVAHRLRSNPRLLHLLCWQVGSLC